MAYVTITIDRGDQKYTTSLDCAEVDRNGKDRNVGDSAEYIGMILADAVNAVFGGEGDLFRGDEVLLHALSNLKRGFREFHDVRSVEVFFWNLAVIFDEWVGSTDTPLGEYAKGRGLCGTERIASDKRRATSHECELND